MGSIVQHAKHGVPRACGKALDHDLSEFELVDVTYKGVVWE